MQELEEYSHSAAINLRKGHTLTQRGRLRYKRRRNYRDEAIKKAKERLKDIRKVR